MNTDRPTPTSRTGAPADSAAVDESSEPTVALGDHGDGEPTVTLTTAETTEKTADPSPAEPAPAAGAAGAGASSETDEAEPTMMLPSDRRASEETTREEDGSEATVTLQAPAEETEETVALSPAAVATDESEPTTVITAESEPTAAITAEDETTTVITAESEPTAAITTEDETTTVITADRPAAETDTADEPTIALPKPRVSPESTVALPVSRVSSPGSEPTIALPSSAGPAPAPGVARPAVPAPRTAPTVTPPPSEPTIALPAAPVRPVVVPLQARPLSRRRLLWAIPAVAGTALAGGTIAASADGDEPEAAKAPTAPNLQVSERTPTPAPSPTRTTPTPTAPIVKEPVHTLADFRKLVPGDAFPADSIALTIDDGPHPVWTPKILRLLEKHHVPATFFMIGNQILGHEATARDVITDGHLIANHTWSHPIKLAKLPPHRSLKEIHRAQDKIYSTTGKTPNLFRAPGGGWSKDLSQSVSQSNMIPIDWTNDPRDWAQPGVAQITSRMLAARPGQILLVHDGGGDRSQTLASLRTVIPALQAKGLKFVALM